MIKKIGRNDPCHCGSGKKYKKCCGKDEEKIHSVPEDLSTGTLVDEYMRLFEGITLYGNVVFQFDEAGKELEKAAKDFEKRFRPGQPDGVHNSIYMCWLHFDFRFGKSQETICERFMKSLYFSQLRDPGPAFVKHLAGSYHTFYEVKGCLGDRTFFEELGTGKKWKALLVETDAESVIPGEVWYCRFVGDPDEGYEYGAPYVFGTESKEHFTRILQKQKEFALTHNIGEGFSDEDVFKESCKASLCFWAGYMIKACSLNHAEEKIIPDESAPVLANTDGELIKWCRIFFRIKQKEGLSEKLSSLRNIDYDDYNKMWVWYKKGNKKMPSLSTTSLGTLSIKDEHLIGETNSVERAERLISKLGRGFKDYLSYEKVEMKDLKDFPPLSKEEREKFEEEQKKINSNPEIAEYLRKRAEEYYDGWLRQKIPALDYKTPLQAVKTADGRYKVEALIKGIERMQEAKPDNPYKVDTDSMREKLNLPVK